MSTDGDKPAGGDAPKRRRRRRRRKPREGSEAPRAAQQSSGDKDAAPSRRRRRRRKPGGQSDGEQRTDSARPRRGRRRRGRRGDGPARETQPARQDAATPETPRSPASLDEGWDVDDGWSLGEGQSEGAALPDVEPAPEGDAIPPPDVDLDYGDEVGLESISTKIAWGDDSDAPTPDIELQPDLPEDPPADDPDPVFAELEADDAEDDRDSPGEVRSVVGVKFATAGKIYLYDGGEGRFHRGQQVVVEGDRGVRIGTVALDSARQRISRSSMKRILRTPSGNDRRNLARNAERSREALDRARSLAREHQMRVKVFRADFSLSGNKCTVYFSAEEKVDSRPLAKELAAALHCRVDVRQTGVRDEAKMVGGIGSCGQELCCTTWLPSFVPVSIKNAKDQGLVLNPSKVSGQCGRLKCCLVYEQETYAALRKGLPKLGKRVVTDDGEGRVVEVDVLRQRIRVNLGDGNFQVYTKDEVKPMFPSQQPNPPRRKS